VTLTPTRLLIVDLDGTLIGSSGVPSPQVVAAIARAISADLRIALCTGRPIASCGAIAKGLGLAGPHVAFNGALLKDPAERAAVFRKPLPVALLDRLIQLGRSEDVCLELYTEETHYVERDWRESRLHAQSIRVGYEIEPFDTFFGRADVIKGQIITADDRARAATQRIAAAFDGQLRLSIAIPMAPCDGMECVNVVDHTVSKGSAVRALLDYYGLKREQVAGAGDALNDLPMLGEVGYRIAMGNAEPEVKAVADLVVADVESDGLAEGIERLLAAR
jgi:Cof subfamily protein (haloacid dehalogenase superfamily)